jgi:hypothetical protein
MACKGPPNYRFVETRHNFAFERALSNPAIGASNDFACLLKALTGLFQLKVPHRNAQLNRSAEVGDDELND